MAVLVATPGTGPAVTTALAAAALTAPVVRVATGLLDGFGNTKSRSHVRASDENTRFRRDLCEIRPFVGVYDLKDFCWKIAFWDILVPFNVWSLFRRLYWH